MAQSQKIDLEKKVYSKEEYTRTIDTNLFN